MNKLLAVALLLGCSLAYAQPKFAPGVRAGVNFAQLTESELGIRTDYYVGGFAGVKFTKHYTLQPEVIYSRQGAKGDYRDHYGYFDANDQWVEGYVTREKDVLLQYLSVAIINKFTFADRVSISVGPSIDALVGNSDVQVENDIDFTFQLGVGARIASGLEAEVRLKKGILNAVTDEEFIDNDEFFGFEDGTNFVVQLGLSYTFGR